MTAILTSDWSGELQGDVPRVQQGRDRLHHRGRDEVRAEPGLHHGGGRDHDGRRGQERGRRHQLLGVQVYDGRIANNYLNFTSDS